MPPPPSSGNLPDDETPAVDLQEVPQDGPAVKAPGISAGEAFRRMLETDPEKRATWERLEVQKRPRWQERYDKIRAGATAVIDACKSPNLGHMADAIRSIRPKSDGVGLPTWRLALTDAVIELNYKPNSDDLFIDRLAKRLQANEWRVLVWMFDNASQLTCTDGRLSAVAVHQDALDGQIKLHGVDRLAFYERLFGVGVIGLSEKYPIGIWGLVILTERFAALLRHAPNGSAAPAVVPTVVGEKVETSPIADAWPPDDGWHFRPGEAAFQKVIFSLRGKPWAVLKCLAEARNSARTWTELADAASPDTNPIKTTIRGYVANARKALKTAFRLSESHDPIPNVESGERTAWRLNIAVLRPIQ